MTRNNSTGPACTNLKVVTWNIKHASAGLRRIASVLNPIEAEVIGLNEVDRCNPRSAFRRQARWLGKALRRFALFGPAASCLYGNALLLAVQPARSLLLPLAGGGEPRSCLWVRLLFRGRPLDVLVTHLGLRTSWRRRQIKSIVSWMTRLGTTDCLLTGDMNAEPGAPEFEPLQDFGLKEVGGMPAADNSPTFADFRLDHVWISAGLRLRSSCVLPCDASDHRPLLARVSMPTLEARTLCGKGSSLWPPLGSGRVVQYPLTDRPCQPLPVIAPAQKGAIIGI